VSGPGVDEGDAVLYARDGCTPCFALRRLAGRSARRHGVRLRVVEVDSDPELVRRFGDQVPVLLLPGGGRLQGRAAARDVEEAFRRVDARRRGSWMRRLLVRATAAVRARSGAGSRP
jgi:hypothetical protein